jgi:prophage regulatory protein
MKILSRREAADRAGVSVSTVKREEAAERWPRRVQITANRVGYLESEIDNFIAERVAERDEWLEAEHEAARPAEPEAAPVWK